MMAEVQQVSRLILTGQGQMPDLSFPIAGMALALILLLFIFASRNRKVPPNQVLESHLRHAAETKPAAEFIERPESLSQSVRESAAPELAALGLECGLFSIQPKDPSQSSVA